MDPISRNVNKNAENRLSDLTNLGGDDFNQIRNLSLEDHNQKLNRGTDELKKQFKRSLGGDDFVPQKSGKLPKASCCAGPISQPHHSGGVNFWTIPHQKLYSAAEDPIRKKYSPVNPGKLPKASCCAGPISQPHHSGVVNFWTIPHQKLYSAAEDPTRKKYSPVNPGRGPRIP